MASGGGSSSKGKSSKGKASRGKSSKGQPGGPSANPPRMSKAERQILASSEGVPDGRRILPTQDWVTFVSDTDLQSVAQAQVLATSHFYTGLVNLKADFSKHILLPPPIHALPAQLLGTLR